VSGDLIGQVEKLSDRDAIAALAFVLDLEDVTTRDIDQLQEDQDRLAEAFAETPDIGEFAAPEEGATEGELARATLIYLAEQEDMGSQVAEAMSRPRREGQRDPFSLAIGGLILLALKSDVQLKRSAAGKWTFSYHLQPTKDSALVGVFSKLWGIFGGKP
jgi:hypothetical protein